MGRKKARKPTMTPEEAIDSRKGTIVGMTDLMRLSDDPYWARFRQLLEGQSIDPYTAVLADSEPWGNSEEGYVVTADRAVYRFAVEWQGTLHETAVMTQWADITDSWPGLTTDTQGRLHRDLIASALTVVAEGL